MQYETQGYEKGVIVSGQNDCDGTELPPARPPVFSAVADRLIKEIWELGGMDELRANIDALKQLPLIEFEHRLYEIRDRLKMK